RRVIAVFDVQVLPLDPALGPEHFEKSAKVGLDALRADRREKADPGLLRSVLCRRARRHAQDAATSKDGQKLPARGHSITMGRSPVDYSATRSPGQCSRRGPRAPEQGAKAAVGMKRIGGAKIPR